MENESLSSSLKRVMELETALEQKEAANVLSKLELEKLKGATVCRRLVVGRATVAHSCHWGALLLQESLTQRLSTLERDRRDALAAAEESESKRGECGKAACPLHHCSNAAQLVVVFMVNLHMQPH